MTAKHLETRQVFIDVMREQLEKLAIKYTDKKKRLRRIQSWQSQLAADYVDDKILGQTILAMHDRFK
jgi:hypothetical protein